MNVHNRKDLSPNNSALPRSRLPMLNGRRLAGAKVSGCATASVTRLSTDATKRAPKMPRHPVTHISADPVNGASMGDTENTSMIAAIIRVASAPVSMSRTIARGTTPKAAAPRPCTTRPAINPLALAAVMHRMLPSTNNAIPA